MHSVHLLLPNLRLTPLCVCVCVISHTQALSAALDSFVLLKNEPAPQASTPVLPLSLATLAQGVVEQLVGSEISSAIVEDELADCVRR